MFWSYFPLTILLGCDWPPYPTLSSSILAPAFFLPHNKITKKTNSKTKKNTKTEDLQNVLDTFIKSIISTCLEKWRRGGRKSIRARRVRRHQGPPINTIKTHMNSQREPQYTQCLLRAAPALLHMYYAFHFVLFMVLYRKVGLFLCPPLYSFPSLCLA